MLLKHGVGCVWAKRYLNLPLECYYHRKIKWLRDYIIFYYLTLKFSKEIENFFEKFSHFSDGKEKKQFEVFKYIWEHPFYFSHEIGEKFSYAPGTVRKIKHRYVIKIEKEIETQEMAMLLYFFNKCVFGSRGIYSGRKPRKNVSLKKNEE